MESGIHKECAKWPVDNATIATLAVFKQCSIAAVNV